MHAFGYLAYLATCVTTNMCQNRDDPTPKVKCSNYMLCVKLIMTDRNNYPTAKCFLQRQHSSHDESGDIFVSVRVDPHL
jgi:hypothetical protein